jgi:para-aminobenzoate synthetase component I
MSAPRPIDLAWHLEPRGGLVWLDSAVATKQGARSLLAAAPTFVLQGTVDADWAAVEQHLQAHAGSAGALMGYIGYDGVYALAHYPVVHTYLHEEQRWLEPLPAFLPAPADSAHSVELSFAPQVSAEAYMQMVRRAKEYIAAGDIYQVNLAYPWQAAWPASASALAWYTRLRQVSAAPHAAYMDVAEHKILSSSPECFLHMQGRDIFTQPIKGTRPRHAQADLDAAAAEHLYTSSKERAELLMITDLERNDLGQVCEYGSVQVDELWKVEHYAQVHHLISTVRGTLRQGISHATALRAAFPGGSITGAPKQRARQIIAELEPHPRGIYTGALGYFSYEGTSSFNIAIRTAIQHGEQIHFHVGSGIVADSDPQSEYLETLHKAAGLRAAAQA